MEGSINTTINPSCDIDIAVIDGLKKIAEKFMDNLEKSYSSVMQKTKTKAVVNYDPVLLAPMSRFNPVSTVTDQNLKSMIDKAMMDLNASPAANAEFDKAGLATKLTYSRFDPSKNALIFTGLKRDTDGTVKKTELWFYMVQRQCEFHDEEKFSLAKAVSPKTSSNTITKDMPIGSFANKFLAKDDLKTKEDQTKLAVSVEQQQVVQQTTQPVAITNTYFDRTGVDPVVAQWMDYCDANLKDFLNINKENLASLFTIQGMNGNTLTLMADSTRGAVYLLNINLDVQNQYIDFVYESKKAILDDNSQVGEKNDELFEKEYNHNDAAIKGFINGTIAKCCVNKILNEEFKMFKFNGKFVLNMVSPDGSILLSNNITMDNKEVFPAKLVIANSNGAQIAFFDVIRPKIKVLTETKKCECAACKDDKKSHKTK